MLRNKESIIPVTTILEKAYMNIFKKAAYKLKKYPKGEVTVIIAAGGSGSRMGGVPKPLLNLRGKPVIEYSLEAFSACECVGRIFIAAKADDIPSYESIMKSGRFPKLSGVVEGGGTRSESVANAFTAAMRDGMTDFVAIHDGARPLITPEETERAAKLAAVYGSGVCASKVRDTVKRASRGGKVTENIDREGLWLISTPQIFSTDHYHAALSAAVASAKKNGSSSIDFTDDSTMFGDAGFTVMLSEASADNIKITYPEDMAVAEGILAARERGKA